MRWNWHITKTASSPSYLKERISDLNHASDLSKISPSEARSLIRRLMVQLEKHKDNIFLERLSLVDSIILDSPLKARMLINDIIKEMIGR